MTKTKIEWCDYTWNPIKGLCPEACWYCYARAIYKRFKLDPKLRWAYEYLRAYKIPAGSKIFVCSTMEIFHPDVPKSWRDTIFKDIEEQGDLTFIVLTKRPERIDRPMPDNVWLGVSVTGREDVGRLINLRDARAKVKFISFEPILELIPYVWPLNPAWVIAGRLTGHGKKRDPVRWQIDMLVRVARRSGAAVFLKNNLSGIWRSPLIQDYPR